MVWCLFIQHQCTLYIAQITQDAEREMHEVIQKAVGSKQQASKQHFGIINKNHGLKRVEYYCKMESGWQKHYQLEIICCHIAIVIAYNTYSRVKHLEAVLKVITFV